MPTEQPIQYLEGVIERDSSADYLKDANGIKEVLVFRPEQIKSALAPYVTGRSNAHQRDALGLARHGWLWATTTDAGIEAIRCQAWEEAIGA